VKAVDFARGNSSFSQKGKIEDSSLVLKETYMSYSHEKIYLLTIRGTLAPTSLEAARQVHNQTAGAPEGVAAARSLGDLSHMVYVPVNKELPELFIMDLWTSPGGLNQFFSDPQVQHGAELIFTQRDPVVWEPAEGFFTYHIPAPTGYNDRFFGLIRGPVVSREQARTILNQVTSQGIHKARRAGHLSHEVYFRLAQPGMSESLELFAIDGWSDLDGMNRYYDDPDFTPALGGLFTAEPATLLLKHPAGEWVEW